MAEVKCTNSKKYWAFISYSSKDRKWGKWLHEKLENYPIPKELQGAEFSNGVRLGKRIRPIFRDRDELAGSAELGPAIQKALGQSRYLIVLCSPNSAKSLWVNKEIEDFKQISDENKILALILDGEPNASSNPALKNDYECFPPALRYPMEPLAGDLRKEGDGKERGFLKILSGVAQVGFDALYRRHLRIQRKRRLLLGAGAAAVITVLTGLTIFAFQQKQIAEQKTIEARNERDQANNNLSNLYYEKANRAEPKDSLAWALLAAETHPQILNDSGFQARVTDWCGPWIGPTDCLATGLDPNHHSLGDSAKFKVSHRHHRIFMQLSELSWRLFDWSRRRLLSSGMSDSTILQIITSDEDWFVIESQEYLEVINWVDGSQIAKIPKERFYSFTVIDGQLFILSYNDSTNTSRILSWRPTQEHPQVAIDSLSGYLQRIVGTSLEGNSFLLGIAKQNESNKLIYFTKRGTQNKWEQLEAPSTEGKKPTWLRTNPAFYSSEIVAVSCKDAHSGALLINLVTGRSYWVECDPQEKVTSAIMRSSTLSAQISHSLEGYDRKLDELNLKSGRRYSLFDKRPISGYVYGPLSNAIVAWSDDSQQVAVCYEDRITEWHAANLPLGLKFFSSEVQEIAKNEFLLRGHSQPGDHELAIIFRLHAGSESHFLAYGAVGLEACLSASRTDDHKMSHALLTHDGAVISYYDHGEQLYDIIATSDSSKHVVQGIPKWIEVNEQGEISTLAYNDDDEKKIQLTTDGTAGPWLDASLGNKVLGSMDDHVLIERDYYQTSVLNRKGTVTWNSPKDSRCQVKLCEYDSRPAVIYATDDRLTLAQLPSSKVIWQAQFNSNIKQFIVSEANNVVLVLQSSSSEYGADSPWFSLDVSNVSLADGTDLGLWNLRVEGEQAAVYANDYSSQFHLIPGQPLCVIAERRSNGLYERQLFQGDGKRLVEVKKWTGDRPVVFAQLPEEYSFLASYSNPNEGHLQLGWFRQFDSRLDFKKIPLTSGLDGAYPAPNGHKVVLDCRNEMLLWDLLENRQIGKALSIETGKAWQREPLSTGNLIWNPNGKSFFVWDWNSIYHFDTQTGDYMRSMAAHFRDGKTKAGRQVEITAVAISTDGNWLCSVDNSGKIVKTKVASTRHRTLAQLRSDCYKLGGKVIMPGSDIRKWIPDQTFR